MLRIMVDELLQPDAALDCTGLYCPQPVIRTAARVKEMRPGQILEVRATDPGFQIDLPAWCLSHHHELLAMRRESMVYVGYVRLNDNSRSNRMDRRRQKEQSCPHPLVS